MASGRNQPGKKRNQQALTCIVLLLLLCAGQVLLCGLALWLPMYANDRRLATFAGGLYDYPLPPDTAVVARRSELGKVGNGNNCWYQAQQSLVSTLSPEEIEQYYDGVVLPRVSFGPMWDRQYDSPRVAPIDLDFVAVTPTDGQSHFTLTLFDVGLDVTLDWRCH